MKIDRTQAEVVFHLLTLSCDIIDRAAYSIRTGVKDEAEQTKLVRALGEASGTIFLDVLERIRETYPDLSAAGYPDEDESSASNDC